MHFVCGFAAWAFSVFTYLQKTNQAESRLTVIQPDLSLCGDLRSDRFHLHCVLI